MKNTIAALSLLTLLFSCNKEKSEENKNVNTTTETTETVVENNEKSCYLKVTEGHSTDGTVIRDSTVFNLERNGDKVTGTFNWLPYEKDKKTGTFEGTVKDNVVTAIYSYMAEGLQQKEEIVFKIEENQVAIKYGELEEINGIWKIKNTVKAKYTEMVPKVDCK